MLRMMVLLSSFFLFQDLRALAKSMLGKTCFVGWPYLVEAKVHSIANRTKLYSLVCWSLIQQ